MSTNFSSTTYYNASVGIKQIGLHSPKSNHFVFNFIISNIIAICMTFWGSRDCDTKYYLLLGSREIY